MTHTMQTRESEMKRAAVALRWSSLGATPHSLLTSKGYYVDRQDEHSWKKTALNKTFQFARKFHTAIMLQREGGAASSGGKHAEGCQASP